MMYTKIAGGAGGVAVAGSGTLAQTGFHGGALLIGAVTLVLAGTSCMRIARNRKKRTT